MDTSDFSTDIFQDNQVGGKIIGDIPDASKEEMENKKIRKMIKDMYKMILHSEAIPQEGGDKINKQIMKETDKQIMKETDKQIMKETDKIILPDSSEEAEEDNYLVGGVFTETSDYENSIASPVLETSSVLSNSSVKTQELKINDQLPINYSESETNGESSFISDVSLTLDSASNMPNISSQNEV